MKQLCYLLAIWTAYLFLSAGPGKAQPPPRLEEVDGTLELSRLPPILDDEEVGGHLRSGLTTTLALRVELRNQGGKQAGGALVTVRFDLWDEVFHVTQIGASGPALRASFASPEALATWWRELRLAVLQVSDRELDLGSSRWSEAHLSIDVVPFSAAEARETQRWFSESVGDAKQSSAEGSSIDEDGDALGRAFRLMMATSIQHRSLRVYRYEPEVIPAGSRP